MDAAIIIVSGEVCPLWQNKMANGCNASRGVTETDKEYYMNRAVNGAAGALAGIFTIGWLVIVVGAIVGWFMNLFAVIGFDGSITESTEGILRLVGIVLAPLGAVMGLFV